MIHFENMTSDVSAPSRCQYPADHHSNDIVIPVEATDEH